MFVLSHIQYKAANGDMFPLEQRSDSFGLIKCESDT